MSDGRATKEVSIPARQTVTISDLAAFLGSSSAASVVVDPLRGELAVTTRAATTTSSGAIGTAMPLVPSRNGLRLGQTQIFGGLEDSAASRTDYGFVETSGAGATIRATLLLSDARSLFTAFVSRDFAVGANGFVFVSELVRSVIGSARAQYGDLHNLQLQLEVTEGGGAILPFVVMNDTASRDTDLRID